MEMETETFFTCPYCWQQVSMLIETAHGSQSYVEDCEVCCQPIEILYKTSDGMLESIQVKKLDD